MRSVEMRERRPNILSEPSKPILRLFSTEILPIQAWKSFQKQGYGSKVDNHEVSAATDVKIEAAMTETASAKSLVGE